MEQVERHQIIPLCSASNYAIRFSEVYKNVRAILNIPYNSVPFVFRYYPGAAEKVDEATFTNGTVKLSIIKYTNTREELLNVLELERKEGFGMFKNTEFQEKFFYFDKREWLDGRTREEYIFSAESSEEEKNRIKEKLYCDSDRYIIPRRKIRLIRYQHDDKWFSVLSESLWNAIGVKAEGEAKKYANELCSLFELANENQCEIEYARSELPGATDGVKCFHRFYFSSDVYKLKTMLTCMENFTYDVYLLNKQAEMERINNMFSGRVQVYYRCESCIPKEKFQNVWNSIKIVRTDREIVIKYKEIGEEEENYELTGYPSISIDQARQIMGWGNDVLNEPNVENNVIGPNRELAMEMNEELERLVQAVMNRQEENQIPVAFIRNTYKKFEVFLYQDSFRFLSGLFIPKNCSICWEDFKGEDVVKRFPCGKHIFHKNCIKIWLMDGNAVCPVCRHNMFAGRKEETGDERKITNYLRNKRYLDEPDEEN